MLKKRKNETFFNPPLPERLSELHTVYPGNDRGHDNENKSEKPQITVGNQ